MDVKKFTEALSVPELHEIYDAVVTEYAARKLEIPGFAGSLAVEGAQTESVTTTPETTREAPIISSESLLTTLDTALTTYCSQVYIANGERAKAKGRKKPEQLEVVDQAVIRAEVEALVSNPAIITELQAEADHFSANPEADSPEVGFDIVVIPEGLTADDDQAIAEDLQAKITSDYDHKPYIRPESYNDKRTPVVTGKGYRIAFAPRHYNVPKGTASNQTSWMKGKSKRTTATELQPATDAEALAQINNLQGAGELNDPNTHKAKSYFRRFDQAPVVGFVSSVFVNDYGRLYLGGSYVRDGLSARALVVPKKLNA